jgi:hypothetical protein
MTLRTTRAQRLAMPLARDVVRELAVTHGGCVRPVQLRRTDIATGQVEQVLVPCGHTLAAVCPACAERAKTLRAAQCRDGWHLDHEPVTAPDVPDDEQRMWVELRAEAQAAGEDTGELDAVNTELDQEITRSGVWGKVMPATTAPPSPVHPAPPRCRRRRPATLARRPRRSQTTGQRPAQSFGNRGGRMTAGRGGRLYRPDDELLTVAEMCAALGGV